MLVFRVLVSNGIFFLALGLALFLPAGSLDFWQAEWFLGLYVCAQMGISLYFFVVDPEFLERRMLRRDAEAGQQWVSRIAGLLTLASLVVAGFNRRFHWWAMPVTAVAAGDLMFLAGFGIVLRVFQENRFASSVVAISQGQKTVTGGPYAVVRHPMYFGTWLMFLAGPFALGCYGCLWFVPPLTLLLALRAVNEERLLRRNLVGYEAYLKRVRWRLVPGVW